MNIKLLIILILADCAMVAGYAQSSGNRQALQAMRGLVESYEHARYLSFDLLYRVRAEEDAGTWLDSLSGSCKMNGKNYWYAMDNTESIGCTGYTVMLFKDDRVMYLARPRAKATGMNPLAMLDSLLSAKDITATVSEERGEGKIILAFPPGSLYKRITYFINQKSGLIDRVLNVVKSDQLYDPEAWEKLTNHEQYAIMEIQFSHYRQGGFDESQFDPHRYFIKEGTEYKTTVNYQDYTIFLGSTDL